ncbi:25S rRNA (uridine-N(3))-methyltransferase [Neolecta irregularis DAH-3]|uniref:25S rRNA (Uridine-N(3))-methyltransferase n=1 Tax=Neolecta irregularis (strain DAH-3) TaxID=1198029 RepID=A0A1U7LR92_NEOID|nr:25S rRNA (uridine-N(3))-methyltransferase [Neolecta irregularis DAH-3]|eukprot:OLL25103.1 25S rRNA (uridine-N(3))-methyltransferase [Neolecta irregularis DAH-3]
MRGKMKKRKLANATDLRKSFANHKQQASTTTKNLKKQQAKTLKSHRETVPFEKESSILLVGEEGDFSFAASLIDYHHLAPEKVVATSYDSLRDLKEKYPHVQEHISSIEASGAQIIYGIDATNLGTKILNDRKFDHIIFNFPHVGLSIKDQDRNIRANQEMLLAFFQSLQTLLSGQGTVVISLADTLPYTLWNIKSLARNTGLRLRTSRKFDGSMYPGYAHQCTIGERKHSWKGEERSARMWIFERDIDEQTDNLKRKKHSSDDDDTE